MSARGVDAADDGNRTPAAEAKAAQRTYTEDELQRRLNYAREAGAAKAWLDLLERFSAKQRQHLANLMAHNWTISAIEIQSSLAKTAKPDGRLEAETSTAELWPDGIFRPKRNQAAKQAPEGVQP